jgi:photosystem II stability/assembly factor-like uncharacterized protein
MKKREKLPMILFVVLGVLFCSQCSNHDLTKWNSVEARINETPVSPWTSTKLRLALGTGIDRSYFFNDKIAYGVKHGNFEFTIYRSSDGGESWMSVSSIHDFGILDIRFVTESQGFIAGFKLKPSTSPSENDNCIMKTDDGGKTWKIVFSSQYVTVNKLYFDNSNMVAVGRSDTLGSPPDSKHLFLVSGDLGDTWSDVSESLNQTAIKANGRIEDFLSNVTISRGRIFVLGQGGSVYVTRDKGASWETITTVANQPRQTGFSHLGAMEDGRLWMAGGARSIEGIWGVLAVAGTDGKLIINRLKDYSFSDLVYLSRNEFVASATNYSPTGGKRSVILYSSNLGGDWEIISSNTTSMTFTSLYLFSADRVLSIIDDGSGAVFSR